MSAMAGFPDFRLMMCNVKVVGFGPLRVARRRRVVDLTPRVLLLPFSACPGICTLVTLSLYGETSESGDNGLESESSDDGGVRGNSISVSRSESVEGVTERFTRRFRMSKDSVLRSPSRSYTVSLLIPATRHHVTAFSTLSTMSSSVASLSQWFSATKSKARCEGSFRLWALRGCGWSAIVKKRLAAVTSQYRAWKMARANDASQDIYPNDQVIRDAISQNIQVNAPRLCVARRCRPEANTPLFVKES